MTSGLLLTLAKLWSCGAGREALTHKALWDPLLYGRHTSLLRSHRLPALLVSSVTVPAYHHPRAHRNLPHCLPISQQKYARPITRYLLLRFCTSRLRNLNIGISIYFYFKASLSLGTQRQRLYLEKCVKKPRTYNVCTSRCDDFCRHCFRRSRCSKEKRKNTTKKNKASKTNSALR